MHRGQGLSGSPAARIAVARSRKSASKKSTMQKTSLPSGREVFCQRSYVRERDLGLCNLGVPGCGLLKQLRASASQFLRIPDKSVHHLGRVKEDVHHGGEHRIVRVGLVDCKQSTQQGMFPVDFKSLDRDGHVLVHGAHELFHGRGHAVL